MTSREFIFFLILKNILLFSFFLDQDSLGKSRAEYTTKLLLELNTDVNGEAIEEHPEMLLKQNPNFFNHFSVVIGCQLDEKYWVTRSNTNFTGSIIKEYIISCRTLVTISQVLWESQVPFVYVNCIGFLGWVRVQVNELAIIESHPDSTIQDLRLDVPFPELIAYMDALTINSREVAQKTPWLVYLDTNPRTIK